MQTFSADLVKAKFDRKLIEYIIFASKELFKDFNLLFHSKMYLPNQMNNVHELYFQK